MAHPLKGLTIDLPCTSLGFIKLALVSPCCLPRNVVQQPCRKQRLQLDSSVELQQLETKRERLRANIDAISKDIARIVREKEEAESEMRKAISLKMVS